MLDSARRAEWWQLVCRPFACAHPLWRERLDVDAPDGWRDWLWSDESGAASRWWMLRRGWGFVAADLREAPGTELLLLHGDALARVCVWLGLASCARDIAATLDGARVRRARAEVGAEGLAFARAWGQRAEQEGFPRARWHTSSRAQAWGVRLVLAGLVGEDAGLEARFILRLHPDVVAEARGLAAGAFARPPAVESLARVAARALAA